MARGFGWNRLCWQPGIDFLGDVGGTMPEQPSYNSHGLSVIDSKHGKGMPRKVCNTRGKRIPICLYPWVFPSTILSPGFLLITTI